ncbi:MAG: glycosyltransferase family 4 protein [Desulfitobacteriaceae bacterium]|nr:glycosyltransferase family 4 protein [Desulfitobacteriaceae bacterium]
MNRESPKKVAFAATIYGHLAGFHLPFMKLFQKKGYEVHAFARPTPGKGELEKIGVICHDTPFQRNPLRMDNIRALFFLISNFKNEQFEIIHVHTPVAAILGRIAAKITHVPKVFYTAHGFHFFQGAPITHWLLYYPLERIMSRWTDCLITINYEDYQRAQKFTPREKICFVPGVGLDTNQFFLADGKKVREKIRREFSLEENDFVILCVAELVPNKNHDQLINAVYDMVKDNKTVHCLIAGTGPTEYLLKKQIREKGLEPYFHFLGQRKDIPEIMAAADIVTLLSKREGLPRVVMEAMAAGKAVVGTDVRGIRDLIIPGRTGYLVPAADRKATAEAFSILLKNPNLRFKMGENSRKQATQYDLKRIMSIMENVYG